MTTSKLSKEEQHKQEIEIASVLHREEIAELANIPVEQLQQRVNEIQSKYMAIYYSITTKYYPKLHGKK